MWLLTLLLLQGIGPHGAAPTGPKRFLLYDTHPGEGYSYRRLLLHRAMSLVSSLHKRRRYRWALVVPHFRERHSWASYGFGEFFNVSTLRSGLPFRVVEANKFLSKHPAVGVLWCHHSLTHAIQSTKPPLRCKHDTDCLTEYHSVDFTKREVPYSGAMVPFTTAECWEHDAILTTRSEALLSSLEAAVRTARSVLLPVFEKVLPYFTEWDAPGYWLERAHVRWADPWEARADAFIAKLPAGGDFVSMHLRRGDFKTAHPGEYSPPEEIAGFLCPTLRVLGTPVVFLATDADPSEVEDVRRAVAHCHPFAVLVTLDGRSGGGGAEGLQPAEVALLDQVVAARGRRFFGTIHSYFSAVIHFARIAHGLPAAHGSQVSRWEVLPLCTPPTPMQDCAMLPW